MIVVERSPLATYGLPQPSHTHASAGGECTSSRSSNAGRGLRPWPRTPGCWPRRRVERGLACCSLLRPYSDFDSTARLAPTSANAVSSAAVRLRYPQRLAQPRVGSGQRLGRALGARFAQLTAQPCILRAQVPDLHTQRHHRATLSRFHIVAASNFVRRCTSACRDNASFAVRRIASVSWRASINLFRLASNRALKEPTWLRATTSAWRHSSARASAAVVRTTSRSYRKRHSCGSSVNLAAGSDQSPSACWPRVSWLSTSCTCITMSKMIAQYLPCYQTPIAVFLSSPVRNESKQSYNSMTKKWSTMRTDPPRTERLPCRGGCRTRWTAASTRSRRRCIPAPRRYSTGPGFPVYQQRVHRPDTRGWRTLLHGRRGRYLGTSYRDCR